MIFNLFRKSAAPSPAEEGYRAIVAQSRQVKFYADWGVPDTVTGRFDMISLHLALMLRRLKGDAAGRPFGQKLVEVFFRDMDESIRELGVSDVGVPKRVKKFARMYYGRLESYAGALENGDLEALKVALRRNVRPDEPDAPDMTPLATYMIEAEAALKLVSEDQIATGAATLIAPQPMERT